MLAATAARQAETLRGYSTKRAARMLGMSLRQLQYCDDAGRIHAARRGHLRIWSAEQLTALDALKELRKKGLRPSQIRSLFARRELRDTLQVYCLASVSPVYLLTDGVDIGLAYNAKDVVGCLRMATRPMVLVELRRFPAY